MEQTKGIFTVKQSREGGAFKTLANPQQLRVVMTESLQALTLDREKLKEFFKNAARQGLSFHSYSFNNLMLAWFQKKDFEVLAGMKQWNKLARSVRKGEKAIYILAPCWSSKKKTEDGEEEKKPARSGRPLFFKSVKVFDIKQTEGKPVNWDALTGAGFIRADGEDGGAATWETLKAFTAAAGFTVEEKNTAQAGGWISGKSIAIHSEISPAAKCAVLLHELGHYKYAHQTDAGAGMSKEVKEAEAEIFSYITGQCFGINNEFTGAYLAAYMKHYKDADIYSLFKYIIDGAMCFLKEIKEFSKLGIAELTQISAEDRTKHTRAAINGQTKAAVNPLKYPAGAYVSTVADDIVSMVHREDKPKAEKKPAAFSSELKEAAEIVKQYERYNRLIAIAEKKKIKGDISRRWNGWEDWLKEARAHYAENFSEKELFGNEEDGEELSGIELYTAKVEAGRQEAARIREAIKGAKFSHVKELKAQLIQFENLLGV